MLQVGVEVRPVVAGKERIVFSIGEIRKKQRFRAEIDLINEEIGRSKRVGSNFGVLAVEVNDTVPRGLSKVMPGKTISFHVLKRHLRSNDRVIGPFVRRYFIILPQTDERGIRTVEARLHRLAEEQDWGEIRVGVAVYPADGRKPTALLDKAAGEPC